MIRDEIKYNVGNEKRIKLMEEINLKSSEMNFLEAEERIMRAVTELGRTISNLEYIYDKMDNDKKEKIYKLVKDKIEVLEKILSSLRKEKEEYDEDEE